MMFKLFTVNCERTSFERRVFFVILFLFLMLFVTAFFGYEKKINSLKKTNAIERKILLNELEEKIKSYSKSYDFNEWLAIHNQHLQNHYNLLLQYDENYLSTQVRLQEKCLSDLAYFAQKGDAESQNEVADKCNKIGRNIDGFLFLYWGEQVGE